MSRLAFVLAGGQSRRMGRDKADLPFGASTLLEHALERLRASGFEPGVAGRQAGAPALASPRTPIVPDLFPQAGPLGGIASALLTLEIRPSQFALFVAVDLPLLPGFFLKSLFDRAQSSSAWVTLPQGNGRPQPLCMVLESSLGPALAEAVAAGDLKIMRVLHSLVPKSQFDCFRVEVLAAARSWNQSHRWFLNLNTPEDWEALQSSFAGVCI